MPFVAHVGSSVASGKNAEPIRTIQKICVIMREGLHEGGAVELGGGGFTFPG
ncbi:hypothetical protein ACFSOZ_15390 [Mesorhizobium newzealandense]|uniref:Uncharacterized protein n=1 Tax=Mesorhizobium newzealandense TaxID=1300302 RepID=A0ABW4UAY3_9HYPH